MTHSLTQSLPESLLNWWDKGHSQLPWRGSRDPYKIWISEVMAQQTQLVTVIPYYQRWIARFPNVESLAQAPLDDVLKLWEGLGYYSRARNLHEAAQTVVHEYNGQMPNTATELLKLKGIGRYTAGAIASICFDEPVPALDGNVIRVLSRVIDLTDDVTQQSTKNRLWRLATDLMPATRAGDYNQSIMELGQKICSPTSPKCGRCPIADVCLARQRGTQQERPVKPARKQIPHYDVVAGVIWQEAIGYGPLLITQRPTEGMLGGLWEFPGGKVEGDETLPEALVREIQEECDIVVDVPSNDPVAVVKHAYTHFRITLYALHALYQEGAIQHLGVQDHAWVTLDQVNDFAFAVTDRKIIAALQQPSLFNGPENNN